MSMVYSYLDGKFHPTTLEFGNHSIGEEWSSLTGVIPAGGVPYLGQLVSRSLYADLWAYVQEKIPGKILSDSEWQALHASQKGTVLAYSTGDGSTTFRMPAFTGYARGAATLDEAGTYTVEGTSGTTGETGVALYGVYAVTTISPIGEANEAGMLEAITTLEASNFVKSVNGARADAAGNVSTMPDYSAGVTLTAPSTALQTYTVPANGVLVYDIMGFNNGYAQIQVNSKVIVKNASVNNSTYWTLNGSLLVAKGDIVTYQTGSVSGKDPTSIKFYPLKGA